MPQYNSDSRILSILKGGENMRLLIDPENILQGAVTRMFSYSRNDTTDSWSLKLVFPSGDELSFVGIASDDNVVLISSIVFISGGEKIRIPSIGSETVVDALGNLSGLPVQLKRNLASLPVEMPNSGDNSFNCRVFFNLAKDALFYGIEGGEQNGPYRGNFNTLSMMFTTALDGEPCSVMMKSITPLVDGKIVVSSSVDIYGLNEKNVKLKYNLGMGRHISSDCFVTKEDKTSPSLMVAFDLANHLSGLYTKQRRKKTGLGKPRSK